jgi:hypothetical protein
MVRARRTPVCGRRETEPWACRTVAVDKFVSCGGPSCAFRQLAPWPSTRAKLLAAAGVELPEGARGQGGHRRGVSDAHMVADMVLALEDPDESQPQNETLIPVVIREPEPEPEPGPAQKHMLLPPTTTSLHSISAGGSDDDGDWGGDGSDDENFQTPRPSELSSQLSIDVTLTPSDTAAAGAGAPDVFATPVSASASDRFRAEDPGRDAVDQVTAGEPTEGACMGQALSGKGEDLGLSGIQVRIAEAGEDRVSESDDDESSDIGSVTPRTEFGKKLVQQPPPPSVSPWARGGIQAGDPTRDMSSSASLFAEERRDRVQGVLRTPGSAASRGAARQRARTHGLNLDTQPGLPNGTETTR